MKITDDDLKMSCICALPKMEDALKQYFDGNDSTLDGVGINEYGHVFTKAIPSEGFCVVVEMTVMPPTATKKVDNAT